MFKTIKNTIDTTIINPFDLVGSVELLENGNFENNANGRQYLILTSGWVITDGGEV
tara:strand:+ start:25 stop:192 length:168 start_codon:yes stop_codon:yes gene_type:complete